MSSAAPPGTAEASPALTKAAEELAKELARVALAESSSNSVAVSTGRDALVELRHLHGIAETVKTNAVAAAAADAATSAAILQKLRDMESRMGQMEASAVARDNKQRSDARLQRFQWAIAHAGHGSFDYIEQEPANSDHYSHPHTVNSKDKVVSILLNAMKGCGSFIGQSNFSASIPPRNHDYDAKADFKAVTAFHNELCDHLQCLTGELPTVTTDHGRRIIRFNAL
jgi:hypothetical protein